MIQTLSRDKLADSQGRIVELNPSAEHTFGWTRTDILGRLMQDTIVPHHRRHAHHHGMARYLTEGTARVLGRDPSQMIGQPMSRFREPQNAKAVKAAEDSIARTGQPVTQEFTYHLPGGDRVGRYQPRRPRRHSGPDHRICE